MRRSLLTGLAGILALALIATPAAAYTILLRDGTTIVAKDVLRIEGDRVIITLPNGTETFIPLEEVDLERTKEFNAKNLDGAVLIEGGEIKGLPHATPEKRPTLGDLIASGQAKTRARDPVRRPTVEPTGPQESAAGYVDLDTLTREAYSDLNVVNELRSYFTSQGLEAQVFRGSQSDHPMVEIVTSSEAAVFKTLQVAAQALPQLRTRHARDIGALELLLQTSRGSSAGQFVMTPELAESLNSGETDVSAFFIQYVQF